MKTSIHSKEKVNVSFCKKNPQGETVSEYWYFLSPDNKKTVEFNKMEDLWIHQEVK